MQMIEAAVALPGVQLGVVAQQPLDDLPERLASRLVGHWQVHDVTDSAQLTWAVRELHTRVGSVDKLFGAYEQLQVPLAEVREHFNIPGMRPYAARRFRDKALMKATLRAAGVPCAAHCSGRCRSASCSKPRCR